MNHFRWEEVGMPCMELSLPKIGRKEKAALAAELTEVFCATTNHPAEIFGIRFFEYDLESASVGGHLCDSAHSTPYLHMLLYCPRLKRTVKQRLASALVAGFSKSLGRSDWIPTIHISEHPYDNVVVNGKLLSDAYEECVKRKFYYELPQD